MSIRCRVRAWSLLSACLGLSFFTGCGGGSSSPPLTPAPPAAAPAPATSEAAYEGAPGDQSGDQAGVQPGMETPAGAGETEGMNSGGLSLNTGMNSGGAMGLAPGGMAADYGGAPGMETFGGSGMMGMNGGEGMGGMMMGRPGMGGPAFEDPAPADDADYLSKAKYAFAIGKEAAAEQYAIAEILANDANAASLLQQIRFAPGARKPALTLRFGVGVNLDSPTAITDYKPIGRTQYATMNGQGGGGSGGGEMSMGSGGMPGGPQGGGAQKTLGDLTGRFGDELIKSFEGAWDSGTFGSIFSDVETIVPLQSRYAQWEQ